MFLLFSILQYREENVEDQFVVWRQHQNAIARKMRFRATEATENTKIRHFDDDDDDDDDVNDGILLRHVTRLYRSNLALL